MQKELDLSKIVSMVVLLAGVLCLLGACGVKPNSLEPPEGSDNTDFPRHYPTY